MRERDHHLASTEQEELKSAPTEEVESTTRFAGSGGHPPPVAGGAFEPAASSQLFAEDDHERELKQKVGALVQSRFGGDMKKAFAHYDSDKNGSISKGELTQLLSDAGVGSGLTRGMWASGIIGKLDGDGDGAISWGEFDSVFQQTARA